VVRQQRLVDDLRKVSLGEQLWGGGGEVEAQDGKPRVTESFCAQEGLKAIKRKRGFSGYLDHLSYSPVILRRVRGGGTFEKEGEGMSESSKKNERLRETNSIICLEREELIKSPEQSFHKISMRFLIFQKGVRREVRKCPSPS